MDMAYGDAFNDMPEEYIKHLEETHRLYYSLSFLSDGKPWMTTTGKAWTITALAKEQSETDKASEVGKKPKAVASLYFKYDGGEWLHMADSLDVQNHLREGIDDNGWRTFTPSRYFTFTISGSGLDAQHLNVGMEGNLVVTLQQGGEIYEGATNITRIHQVISGDKHECSSVSFDMERDEKKKLPYTPDLLPDAIPSLNRCPDCDNTLEQRFNA
jgi:hypothetical protein